MISAVLLLLFVPVVVVSNVLAVPPQPPPPPQHPREDTVVVVQVVQFVVVVEVTSQVTNIIPIALVVSPPAAGDQSPVTAPPSTPQPMFASMDAVGLVTGSIAMLGAATYLITLASVKLLSQSHLPPSEDTPASESSEQPDTTQEARPRTGLPADGNVPDAHGVPGEPPPNQPNPPSPAAEEASTASHEMEAGGHHTSDDSHTNEDPASQGEEDEDGRRRA